MRTAHDTAIKGAESDSLSRAAKKFGAAFGLNLYKKEGSQAQTSYSAAPRQASGNPFQAPSAPQANSNGAERSKGANVGNASDKQAYQMRKAGWTDAQIEQLSRIRCVR
jgi:hypothetical protein